MSRLAFPMFTRRFAWPFLPLPRNARSKSAWLMSSQREISAMLRLGSRASASAITPCVRCTGIESHRRPRSSRRSCSAATSSPTHCGSRSRILDAVSSGSFRSITSDHAWRRRCTHEGHVRPVSEQRLHALETASTAGAPAIPLARPSRLELEMRVGGRSVSIRRSRSCLIIVRRAVYHNLLSPSLNCGQTCEICYEQRFSVPADPAIEGLPPLSSAPNRRAPGDDRGSNRRSAAGTPGIIATTCQPSAGRHEGRVAARKCRIGRARTASEDPQHAHRENPRVRVIKAAQDLWISRSTADRNVGEISRQQPSPQPVATLALNASPVPGGRPAARARLRCATVQHRKRSARPGKSHHRFRRRR